MEDARKKHFFKTVLPKEDLEKLDELTNPQIAKLLNTSVYMVKKSLAHHGLYKGKVYRKICPACNVEFFDFTSATKYCSNYCKHNNQQIWNRGLTKNDNEKIMDSSIRMKGNKLNTLVQYQDSNKIDIHLPILNINIKYDANSKLEKEWLLQADKTKGIVNIKNCNFSIPYADNHKKQRNYYPDFLAYFETGLKWVVEIKGEMNENDICKIQASRDWCSENGFEYKIITTGMIHRADWTFVFAEPKAMLIPSVETVFMNNALVWANMSISNRLNVGCIIVSNDNREIMGYGYNGDVAGGANIAPSNQPGAEGFIHAEENALLKVKNQQPAKMFVTHAPCLSCAKRIVNSGYVKEVYYIQPYRDLSGVGCLVEAGIRVYHFHLVDYLGNKYTEKECFEKLSPNFCLG
jgi:dCMP deaminase